MILALQDAEPLAALLAPQAEIRRSMLPLPQWFSGDRAAETQSCALEAGVSDLGLLFGVDLALLCCAGME
jgi:hypothetical protein